MSRNEIQTTYNGKPLSIVYVGKPFQKIPDACRTTGLSQFMLRKMCRDGTAPHIRSGQTYYINVPALLEQLGVPFQLECNGAAQRKTEA